MSQLLDFTAQLDNKFAQIRLYIQQCLIRTISKADRLRIYAWLRKLSASVENQIWKKNRNLYAQVLMLMLSNKQMFFPFNKNPPDQPLPKLSLYEIPYNIRQQLKGQTYRKKSIFKQNYWHLQHKNNKQNINNCNIQQNKFQLYQKSSQKQQIIKKNKKIVEHNQQQQNMKFNHKKPELRSCQTNQQSQKLNKILQVMKQTLYFLSKHHKVIESNPKYLQILNDIVQFGQLSGVNFRELQFSMIQ